MDKSYEIVIGDDGRIKVYRESDGKTASPEEEMRLAYALGAGELPRRVTNPGDTPDPDHA